MLLLEWWIRSTFVLLLFVSLLEVTESKQVVSLVVKNPVDNVAQTSTFPVTSQTQLKVAKVLKQAQDREKLAVEEVLKQQKEEQDGKQQEEKRRMGSNVGNLEKIEITREEETLEEEDTNSIDTVAKLFQWSILASTNRNTESMVKKSTKKADCGTDKRNQEEGVSFIQYVSKFFRKARSHIEGPWKTHSLNSGKYAATQEQVLLFSVLEELFQATNEEEKTDALEILAELSHKIENAKDVLALGGIERILELLSAPSARVRSLSLYTLAVCAQNNEIVQMYLMQPKRLRKLVYIAEEDEESDVRTTALLALSSVVDNIKGMDILKVIDGVEFVLFDAVQNEDDLRAIRRALNLASDLVVLDASHWLEKLKRVRIFEFAEYYLEHHENMDIRESAAQLLSLLQE